MVLTTKNEAKRVSINDALIMTLSISCVPSFAARIRNVFDEPPAELRGLARNKYLNSRRR
jgi:hypothetical protein